MCFLLFRRLVFQLDGLIIDKIFCNPCKAAFTKFCYMIYTPHYYNSYRKGSYNMIKQNYFNNTSYTRLALKSIKNFDKRKKLYKKTKNEIEYVMARK